MEAERQLFLWSELKAAGREGGGKRAKERDKLRLYLFELWFS